ncbi:hypothetical protein [Stieleria tagensis]|uniref:hypothetical protein n=1 Tax=Stieleria tagensis TaxID=2956795 RepID=UPI00209B5119|nr:hypothetical protein [Stieleria tagensis]
MTQDKQHSVDQCVVAEFRSLADADIGLQVLEKAHFTNENVSVVSQRHDNQLPEIESRKTTDSLPIDGGATAGAVVGGGVGTALGTASLIGPFLVAGPLLGMALGAGAAGLLTATQQWGMKEADTHNYEQRIREGAVLIIVAEDRKTRLDEAEQLLQTAGPRTLQRFPA